MKKLFYRFYESEFTNDKFIVEEKDNSHVEQLFRMMMNSQSVNTLGWRERGYMLVDNVSTYE